MMTFGTKAENLKACLSQLKHAIVLPLEHFTVAQWKASSKEILQTISSKFSKSPCIIRSSAVGEDSMDSTMAGAFLTLPNIPANDSSAF